MSASVDVLEVLDRRAAHAASIHREWMALDLRVVKEVIAELIAADEEYDAADRRYASAQFPEGLKAALARLKEAQCRRAAALAACKPKES